MQLMVGFQQIETFALISRHGHGVVPVLCCCPSMVDRNMAMGSVDFVPEYVCSCVVLGTIRRVPMKLDWFERKGRDNC